MDTRSARRAAEKAARDLINSRAALVGELGVAHAERTHLSEGVGDATERGRQLLADAQAEADRLVSAAQALAQEGQQRYTDAYNAATATGWTPGDLDALGFAATDSNPRRRRPSPEPVQPATGEVTVPRQADLQPSAATS